MSCAYPKELNAIGDLIRKRRLDQRLLQRELAQRIGVDTTSVVNWEKGRSTPELKFLPAMIAFIGYDPRPKPGLLPELLVWFRNGKGWSQKQFAAALRIDPPTGGSAGIPVAPAVGYTDPSRSFV